MKNEGKKDVGNIKDGNPDDYFDTKDSDIKLDTVKIP